MKTNYPPQKKNRLVFDVGSHGHGGSARCFSFEDFLYFSFYEPLKRRTADGRYIIGGHLARTIGVGNP